MLISLAVTVLVALVTALAAIPPLRMLALRLGITDKPDDLLKPHEKVTAYLGGAGFYLAWLAGLVAWQIARPDQAGCALWVVAGIGGLVMLTGMIDDARGLPPRLRMLAEVAAGAALWLLGVRWQAIPGLAADSWQMMAIGLVLQTALVVMACNALNLLDGLDGLCGGVTAIAMLGLAAVAGGALWLGESGQAQALDARLAVVIALCVALAGGLIGFLVYNYKPASIFMGDSGSLLLGFVVATIGILLCGPGLRGLHLGLSGMVVVGVPIADTVLALYRRTRLKRPLFEGDRSHFYDQLVDRGLSVPAAVNICYAMGLGYAAIGWVGGVLLGFWPAMGLYAVTVIATVVALKAFGFTRTVPAPDDSAEAQD